MEDSPGHSLLTEIIEVMDVVTDEVNLGPDAQGDHISMDEEDALLFPSPKETNGATKPKPARQTVAMRKRTNETAHKPHLQRQCRIRPKGRLDLWTLGRNRNEASFEEVTMTPGEFPPCKGCLGYL